MSKIILIKQAIKENLKFYFTGKPCRRDHICKRYTIGRKCIICIQIYNKNNKEIISKLRKIYQHNNKEPLKEYSKHWYKDNCEFLKAKQRIYQKENKSIYNANNAKYHAVKLQAIPLWYEKELIESLYKESSRLSKSIGIKHHVDHIVPLTHKLVCGLHCQANLQILTATENHQKYNTFKIGA